tara:strand:- start:96 stop:437 length:342 start_codon:yes stop_codon:yes gene_type:complete
MAVVIKPKKSETASSAPTTSDLAAGEIAVNTADKKIYIRDSSSNIITLAQYGEFDQSLIYPGSSNADWGSIADDTQDAFGIQLYVNYDCLGSHTAVTPSIKFRLATEDHGALS